MRIRAGNPVTRWAESLARDDRATFWASFAALFALMFCAMNSGTLLGLGGFLWYDDGLTQQYTTFYQLGQWLRDVFAALASGQEIPLWDESLGYGGDVLEMVSASLGNPINLLSVFSTAENADKLLVATVPVTLLASALAFVAYARYHHFDGFSTLVGCMAYVFSGWTLLAFCQIYMLWPLVLAPVMFMGADKMFDRRGPVQLTVGVALFCLNGPDVGYVACLLLVLYCLVRYWQLPERKSLRNFAGWFFRIAGCAVLGIVISSLLFLPLASAVLNQSRLDVDRAESLLYSPYYYLRIIAGFVGYAYAGSECFVGFSPIVPVSVVTLVLLGRGAQGGAGTPGERADGRAPEPADVAGPLEPAGPDGRADDAAVRPGRLRALLRVRQTPEERMRVVLLALFLVCTLMLLLPVCGSVMNGLSYANNRWLYAYSLLGSFVVMAALPRMRELTRRDRRDLVCACAVCTLVGLVGARLINDKGTMLAYAIVLALSVVIAASGARSAWWHAGVVTSLVLGAAFVFAAGDSVGVDHVPYGEAYATVTETTAYALISEADEGKDGGDEGADDSRYDLTSSAFAWRNTGVVTGADTVSYYNSMYNGAIDEYHTALGLATSAFNFSYTSLDSRTVLEQFAGVRYLLASEGDAELTVPDLYASKLDEAVVCGTTYGLYASESVLPLAFTYDRAISEEEFYALAVEEREYSLLEAVAVADEDVGGDTDGYSPSDGYSTELSYAATCVVPDESGGQAEPYEPGESFTASDLGVTVHLDVEVPAGKQLRVTLSDMTWEQDNSLTYTDDELASMSIPQRVRAFLRSLVYPFRHKADEKFCFTVSCGGVGDCVTQMQPTSSLYGGKDTWVAVLGSSDEARSGIDISFFCAGTYSIGSITVSVEDEKAVSQGLEHLATGAASDINLEGNTLSCVAEADKDGTWLFFRLPYSRGWSATVDGQQVEVVQANIGFMAVRLDAGTHEVTLHYETPWLRVGACASLAGVIVLAVIGVLSRRRRRARKAMTQPREP